MAIDNAADPAALASIQGNIEGGWHVHPSGWGFNSSGQLEGFNQNPSQCSGCDVDHALPGTNIVVGAESQVVTFYSGTNPNLGQMTLSAFESLPQ
jgi:hypothetical protein